MSHNTPDYSSIVDSLYRRIDKQQSTMERQQKALAGKQDVARLQKKVINVQDQTIHRQRQAIDELKSSLRANQDKFDRLNQQVDRKLAELSQSTMDRAPTAPHYSVESQLRAIRNHH